jgi:2-methylisocitrate lyase-like PEP mutase family enzyme
VGRRLGLGARGDRALATPSCGFAFTLGRVDGKGTLDEVIDHVHLVE